MEAAEDEAPVVDETLAGELETAFAEQAPVEELEASPAVIDAEVSDADLDEAVAAHFDDHLAAGVAEELALADEELTALDEEPAAIEPEAAEAPVELEAAKEPVEPEAAEEPAVAELEPVEELAAAEPERVAEPELVAELEAAAGGGCRRGTIRATAEVYDDDADDLPLIPLGAARDFAGADDMEFDGGFADEPAQPAGDPSAQADEADDDDLEAELSVLLGKGPAVAVAAIPAVETETAGYDEAAPAAVEADDAAPRREADDAAPVVAESAEPAELADDGWAVDIDDPLPLVAETAEPETAEVETVETEAVAEPASISLAEIPAGEPVRHPTTFRRKPSNRNMTGPNSMRRPTRRPSRRRIVSRLLKRRIRMKLLSRTKTIR